MRLPSLAFSLAFAAVTTGCAGSIVYDRTTPPRVESPAAAHVAVRTTHAGAFGTVPGLEAQIAHAVRESGLAEHVSAAVPGVSEDASAAALRVTFHVRSYVPETRHVPRGGIAVSVLGGVFIFPLAFVGLVRSHTVHRLEYDAMIHAADGSSDAAPLFRRTYDVEVRSARNWIRADAGVDPVYATHQAEIAEEIARRMVGRALPDLVAALQAQP